jgi:hypothetical protein
MRSIGGPRRFSPVPISSPTSRGLVPDIRVPWVEPPAVDQFDISALPLAAAGVQVRVGPAAALADRLVGSGGSE